MAVKRVARTRVVLRAKQERNVRGTKIIVHKVSPSRVLLGFKPSQGYRVSRV